MKLVAFISSVFFMATTYAAELKVNFDHCYSGSLPLMHENEKTTAGRIPIFWVNRRLTPEVNLPCFSAYSTVRLCNTPEALTSPRHFLDTKRCSALSTAG